MLGKGFEMNMTQRILLINPPSDCVEDDRVEPPLGLLYLASALREKKYDEIQLYDMTGCKTESDIARAVGSIPEANIYGISCFCTNYQYAKRIIRHIKNNNPLAYVIIGGPHPSGLPEFILEDSEVDVVVTKEGEDTFCELVETSIKGEAITGVVQGKYRKYIDSYAFPARDLVDVSTYSRTLMGQRVISIISSRGCASHCIHCNSVVMGGGNKHVRFRSPHNIIEEIESLVGTCTYFRFNDDHFTGNPNIQELLMKIRKLDIRFRIFANVEYLSEEICQLLKKAGCVHVSVGMESLNPDNLRVLGKARQIGKEDNIKIAKDQGLVVRSSFIVGLPYDNDQNIEKFFQKASQSGIDEFAVYPLIPYPGTRIWRNPKRYGYTITNPDFTRYVQMGKGGRTCYALQHENFTSEDMKKWKKIATTILEGGGATHMSKSKIAK